MTKRNDPLKQLFMAFLNQKPPPSETDLKYVSALRAKIDALQIEMAVMKATAEAKHD